MTLLRKITLALMIGSCAALALPWLTAPAGARPPGQRERTRTAVLHPQFQRVAGSELIASSRYVFIGDSPQPQTGVLIDGQTGRRQTVVTSGCQPSALGGPWLALTCGTPSNYTYTLYNAQSGRSQPLTSTVRYQNCTVNCDPIIAVGARWVAFEAPPSDAHLYPTFSFQNIDTGRVLNDPTTATQNVDLGTRHLVQPVCHPLSVPRVSNVDDSGWGSLTADGTFAIATGSSGSYLERCGTKLHQFLTYTTPGYQTAFPGCASLRCAPVNNARAIVWQSAPRRLSGIYLPSRRRFTIPIPARVDATQGSQNDDAYRLALTPTRLYLMTPAQRIWSIRAPSQG